MVLFWYFCVTLSKVTGTATFPTGLLEDNARLLSYFLWEVVQFDDFAMCIHARGVSIGLAFPGNYPDDPNPGRA